MTSGCRIFSEPFCLEGDLPTEPHVSEPRLLAVLPVAAVKRAPDKIQKPIGTFLLVKLS